MAASIEALDATAERLGLLSLTAFADNRPIPEGFTGDPEELRDVRGASPDWFDPTAGRRAVSALADAIATRPDEFEGIDDPAAREDVEAELRDLSDVLARAAAEGLRFRLELS